MRISSKQRFAYPILTESGQDYVKGYFQFEIDSSNDTYSCEVHHKQLKILLDANKIKLLLSISCSSTIYHELIPIKCAQDQPFLDELPALKKQINNLAGSIEILPLLISAEDIKTPVVLGDTNPVFGSAKFPIRKNQILGIGEKHTIPINNEGGGVPLGVFKLEPDDSMDDGDFRSDPEMEIFTVYTHSDTLARIRRWKDFGNTGTYYTAVYLPILVEALSYVWFKKEDESDPLDDNYWYQALKTGMIENGVDPDNTNEWSILGMANKLLKCPFLFINEGES